MTEYRCIVVSMGIIIPVVYMLMKSHYITINLKGRHVHVYNSPAAHIHNHINVVTFPECNEALQSSYVTLHGDRAAQ